MRISGSNPNVERIFLNIKNVWADEKSRMDVQTVSHSCGETLFLQNIL